LTGLLKERFGVFFSTIQTETEICGEDDEARAIDFLRTGNGPEANEESSSHPLDHSSNG
jgi:hypothetical protein